MTVARNRFHRAGRAALPHPAPLLPPRLLAPGPGGDPERSPHAILRRRAGRKGEAAGRSAAAATFWTLACAAIIAVYSLIDAAGVRASGGTERYVAIVAALRETSGNFAALIGTSLLKEDQLRERIWGATAMLAGLIAPKL